MLQCWFWTVNTGWRDSSTEGFSLQKYNRIFRIRTHCSWTTIVTNSYDVAKVKTIFRSSQGSKKKGFSIFNIIYLISMKLRFHFHKLVYFRPQQIKSPQDGKKMLDHLKMKFRQQSDTKERWQISHSKILFPYLLFAIHNILQLFRELWRKLPIFTIFFTIFYTLKTTIL